MSLSREILKWIQTLDLTYSVKNIKRDFMNGFLVAEMISKYDSNIEMQSFSTGINLSSRKDNWTQLRKYFEKNNLPISAKMIENVCEDSVPYSATPIVETVYRHLTKRTGRQRGARNPSKSEKKEFTVIRRTKEENKEKEDLRNRMWEYGNKISEKTRQKFEQRKKKRRKRIIQNIHRTKKREEEKEGGWINGLFDDENSLKKRKNIFPPKKKKFRGYLEVEEVVNNQPKNREVTIIDDPEDLEEKKKQTKQTVKKEKLVPEQITNVNSDLLHLSKDYKKLESEIHQKNVRIRNLENVQEESVQNAQNQIRKIENLERRLLSSLSAQKEYEQKLKEEKESKIAVAKLVNQMEQKHEKNKELILRNRKKNELLFQRVKLLKNENAEISKSLQNAKMELSKESYRSRLDLKILEIQTEEFFYFDATKYSSHFNKLEFHHNIGLFNSKFACRFMKDDFSFHNYDSFVNIKRPCIFFENVIVSQREDESLRRFVEFVTSKLGERIQEERQENENLTENLKDFVHELIYYVLDFFYPKDDDNDEEEIEGEEERRKIRRFFGEESGLTETYVREETKKGILFSKVESERTKRVTDGKNNLFLGDLENYYGLCRHRSTLFKVVCDALKIKCKMIFIHGYHAWNIVQLKHEFFCVDLMRSTNIIPVEEYQNIVMRNELDKKDVEEDTKESIRFHLRIHDLKKLKIQRLQDFVLRRRRDEYEVLPTGKKGGGGDITLFEIKKDVKLEEDVENCEVKKNTLLFQKGEVLAIKKIIIVEEGNRKNDDDGIPRKYALREAKNMKILDHSSIINVIGYWERKLSKPNHLFIAMKAMDKDGKDFMRDLVSKLEEKKMTETQIFIETILFFLEVGRGLRYLSTLQIVHLDLKPENVMISWDEEKLEVTDVRIIDFGGAKNNDLTTSTFHSTEKYDSPEIQNYKEIKKIKEKYQNFRKGGRGLLKNEFLELRNRIELLKRVRRVVEIVGSLMDMNQKQPKKYPLSNDWKKNFEEKLVFEKFSELKDFDCRSDVFSFGVMMEEFMEKGLLPFELEEVKRKCLMVNRLERCSVEETIFCLRNSLAFFNQKEKILKE